MNAPGIIYKKFSMAFRLAFSALAILLAGFILVQSLTEAHSSITVSNMDKVVHLAAYFVLGAATLPALPRLKPILVWGAAEPVWRRHRDRARHDEFGALRPHFSMALPMLAGLCSRFYFGLP